MSGNSQGNFSQLTKLPSATADSDAQVGLGIPSSFTKPSLSGHFLYTGRCRQPAQRTDMVNKIKGLERLIQSRTLELAEDTTLYLMVADELERTGDKELIKRAEFIRRQCNGDKADNLFNENRKSQERRLPMDELIQFYISRNPNY